MGIVVVARQVVKGDVLEGMWFVYGVVYENALVKILVFHKRARSCVWKELQFAEYEWVRVAQRVTG